MNPSTQSTSTGRSLLSPQRLPVTAPTRSESVSSDSSVKSLGIQASVASLQVEASVGCANVQSRRHGRFLVQPLLDSAAMSATPTSLRAPSPANSSGSKPPLVPTKVHSSPTPSNSAIIERRPSRIIGRFEVCELFSPAGDDCKSSSSPKASSSPPRKPVDLISIDQTGATETCATTPVKGND